MTTKVRIENVDGSRKVIVDLMTTDGTIRESKGISQGEALNEVVHADQVFRVREAAEQPQAGESAAQGEPGQAEGGTKPSEGAA